MSISETCKIVFNRTVVLASLGYLIDLFDFFLFNMLRVKSLTDLGFSGSALTEAGLFIANIQLFGLLLGSYLSGVAGDRFGRKSCLLVAILLYSTGSIASAFVQSVPQYALARFFTGLGLAGELGQGLALISERLDGRARGPGVLMFFVMGFVGVIAAGLACEYLPWRVAYGAGGVAGLLILALRSLLDESELFLKIAQQAVRRGGLGVIFKQRALLFPFIGGIFLVAPAVFTPQLLWTLSPEIARGFGMTETVHPHIILMLGFSSFILFDFLAMLMSERRQSRREATLFFLFIASACFAFFLVFPPTSRAQFYLFNCLMAATSGVWVVALVWIAEHFGTNIRSTVATTIPNFSRALAIPMNLAFGALSASGTIYALGAIGGVVLLLSCLGWYVLQETYGTDLDFLEE